MRLPRRKSLDDLKTIRTEDFRFIHAKRAKDQFTTRIDFVESDNSQWFGRYSWGDELLTDGRNFEAQDEPIVTAVDQFMLTNIHTFSPTLVNKLRLGANLFEPPGCTNPSTGRRWLQGERRSRDFGS